jgi:hypothetical protein
LNLSKQFTLNQESLLEFLGAIFLFLPGGICHFAQMCFHFLVWTGQSDWTHLSE